MKKVALSVCCLLPLMAACSSPEGKIVRSCPQIAILRPLEEIRDFGSDTVDPSNLVARGHMSNVHGDCTYEDKGAEVSFTLEMVAHKGPRLGGNTVSFPYFVSVLNSEDKVIAKDLMTATFTFPDGKDVAVLGQPLQVFMPLGEKEDAAPFRILMGYQLTEAQLKAQRASE